MAQRPRVEAPVGAIAAPLAEEDAGVAVEMFENQNLDRYLRRAQAFLDREDYPAAIQVLQDVVEGRTTEVIDGASEPGADKPGPASADGSGRPTPPADPATNRSGGGKDARARKAPTALDLDARQAVFCQEPRLYRPVQRLCQELMANMPPVGIELYRATYEPAASAALTAAEREGSLQGLEQVTTRWFVTHAAGRAMQLAADRMMHEGRYRSAVQVLNDLLEIYPKDQRRQLGISDVWCRFKVALCLRLAGEVAVAHAAALELAKDHPDETLRILGELQAVSELPGSAVFAGEVLALVSRNQEAQSSCLGPETEVLVPLWQHRFRNRDPYRDPKATNSNDNVVILGDGVASTTMPFAGRYGPGTQVAFWTTPDARPELPLLAFQEHFRLRVADALSGVHLQQGDGPDEPPSPRDGHPRVRIAATDFATLRPVDDGERRYVLFGHLRNTSRNTDVLEASELVAHDARDMRRVWTSADWLDGTSGLRDVTFLAAPTVFGERLLLPSRRSGRYALECIDRKTGRPLWNVWIHAGGSPFFKAPGAPVVVQGGVAYVLTNAGCLAAVDAFAGSLRWIRRYEREDSLRPRAKPKRAGRREMHGSQFTQSELPSFLPNEIVTAEGLLVIAPCDGDELLCLDGATGRVVWMVDSANRYAPFGRLRTIVGSHREDLFLTSDTHLVCIGLRGGLVRWARELSAWNGTRNSGRGRGAVVGDQVVVPGERELLVFPTDGRPGRRLALPPFVQGQEPLPGSFHVAAQGPWVAIGYQGGVEVFSSAAALERLALTMADPLRRAECLTAAGAEAAAEEVLRAVATDATAAHTTAAAARSRLLSLVRRRALAAAARGDLQAGLAVLDGMQELLDDGAARLHWHMARIDACRDAGDLQAYEREQQRLYALMEGRR